MKKVYFRDSKEFANKNSQFILINEQLTQAALIFHFCQSRAPHWANIYTAAVLRVWPQHVVLAGLLSAGLAWLLG